MSFRFQGVIRFNILAWWKGRAMYRFTIILGIIAGMFGASWVLMDSSQAQQPTSRRKLGPGVLRVIPTSLEESETVQGAFELPEIVSAQPDLQWTPNFISRSRTIHERAKQVNLRRAIWGLEFTFKPLRMIEVDVPQPSVKMRRKMIWYMVYRVRYLGSDLYPVPTSLDDVVKPPEDFLLQLNNTNAAHFPPVPPLRGAAGPLDPKILGSYEGFYRKVMGVGRKDLEYRRFFPHLVLRSHDYKKEYLDRVIPSALKPVSERERVGRPLHNSVQMAATKVMISDGRIDRGVWGIATWEDVDPRTDHFSVYIQGLTNAYKFLETSEDFKPSDPPGKGRQFKFKTLQLNFWRPGDSVLEHETEVRYGIPIKRNEVEQAEVFQRYGVDKRLDYRWIYR
jgi:hypothetical protein